jgi:hypothetical protein
METIAARPVTTGEPTIRPWILRAMTILRREHLRRLCRAALEGMNAATHDAPPEFYRFPFP